MLDRQDALLVRIIVGLYSFHQDKPLYECLMLKARELNLLSATATQGRMGLAAIDVRLARKSLAGPWDTPIVIELVDLPDRIREFIEAAEPLLANTRTTVQEVTMLSAKSSAAEKEAR